MDSKTFPNGLPFQDQLKNSLDKIQARVFKNNKAGLIILDGGLGEGKTTLAVHMADYIAGKNIDLKINYSMGGNQFQERLIQCHERKERVLIYDEAGDFSKHQAISSFNNQLNRVFETFRAFKILLILVLPNMCMLDGRLFDLKIPRLGLYVHGRDKIGHYAAYSLYQMFYLRDLMGRLKIKSVAYKIQIPNYRGHFYNLSQTRAAELDKISIEGKLDIVSIGALKAKGLLDKKDLCKLFDKSPTWIFFRLKELKLEPTKFYKHRAYYDQSTVEKIKEWQTAVNES